MRCYRSLDHRQAPGDQFQGCDVGHIEAIILYGEFQGLTQEFVFLARCRF